MLKMIIVDDEKIIRETIHSLIDWNSLGIDVAAVCKDGIEAFDCILDEYPDIVMTDIKMPGLSGLDLIEKVRAAQLNTEFIILSGYGEFEFARTAMRYGVKHYLLKPSNETEITQVIVSCVETCKSKTASRVDSLLTQLFLTEMPPEKLLQRRFFTELSGEQDVDLAKTQIIRLVMEASKKEYYPLSKLQTTDSLMAVNVCVTMNDLIPSAEQIMTSIFSVEPQHKYTDCVEKVIKYIGEHLSDSNLSLKWISENYLFMNPDYVSKMFVKQTGSKFSAYVTELRIQEAKKLLLEHSEESPYAVAEMVGFGNNPQYFSQIFKKYTKLSPKDYVKSMLWNRKTAAIQNPIRKIGRCSYFVYKSFKEFSIPQHVLDISVSYTITIETNKTKT